MSFCLLIVVLGCLGSLVFFTRQYRLSMDRLLYDNFDKILALQTDYLEDEVLDAKTNVKRLVAMVRILNLSKTDEALPYLRKVMEDNIRYQPNEFNTYFALGPDLARKYCSSKGYVYTVFKDKDYVGPSADVPLSDKVFRDPAYQTDPEQHWYQDTRASKDCVVTQAYFDEQYMKVWMITVGQGIYAGDRFMGMAGIDILLERVLKVIEDIPMGKTGGLLIVNRVDGTVYTRCDGGKREFLDCPRRLELNLYATPEGKQCWGRIVKHSVSQAELVNGQGKTYIVSTRLVRGLPWTLVAFQAREELQEEVNNSAKSFGVSALLVLALLASVSYFLYLSLALPIRSLVATMQRVTGARVQGLSVPLCGTSETRLLGAIFNQMIETVETSFEQLDEANRTLEQRVEGRTAELKLKNDDLESALQRLNDTQEQLVAKEKLASLGALTAGIAHEIKNPLNFVINFAELSKDLIVELRESTEPVLEAFPDAKDDFVDIVGTIEQNAKKICEHGRRADSIVKNMLLHSRGKSGDRQLVDFSPLVEEYVNLAYHGMRAADASLNVDLQKSLDPKVGQVDVVPQDFGRALVNVVNNALYAANHAGREDNERCPQVRVQTVDLGDRVETRVRDNGPGIPPEVKDKIFNPFFTTKPTGAGTGLGLSITYDIIVQVHRGSIRIETEEGAFTEFILTIPKKAASG